MMMDLTTYLLALGLASLGLYWVAVWVQRIFLSEAESRDRKLVWWQVPVQFIYFVGGSYLALITGLIPARFFGLTGMVGNFNLTAPGLLGWTKATITYIFHWALSWLSIAEAMISIGGLLSLLVIIYFGLYFRTFRTERDQSISFVSQDTLYPTKLEICFDFAHWVFYRTILWRLLDNLYLATLGGTFLILIEYGVAYQISRPSKKEEQRYWLRFAISFVTTLIFFTVPNLWTSLLFQILLALSAEMLFAWYKKSGALNAQIS
ncbi:MAG: hypothetical protein AAF629_04455 [Chloroflexota bacterium]